MGHDCWTNIYFCIQLKYKYCLFSNPVQWTLSIVLFFYFRHRLCFLMYISSWSSPHFHNELHNCDVFANWQNNNYFFSHFIEIAKADIYEHCLQRIFIYEKKTKKKACKLWRYAYPKLWPARVNTRENFHPPFGVKRKAISTDWICLKIFEKFDLDLRCLPVSGTPCWLETAAHRFPLIAA